jgi:hypothetical protein
MYLAVNYGIEKVRPEEVSETVAQVSAAALTGALFKSTGLLHF